MKHRVFVTGAAGYVGAMLCDLLNERDDVECIIGLDKEPIPELLKDKKKVTWIDANTSEDTWRGRVQGLNPDVVIHTAWQIREIYGEKRQVRKWNVKGSCRVFDFAFQHPSVKKLIHFSTIASYAAFSSNGLDHAFTENDPLRPSNYAYAEQKREVENILKAQFDNAQRRREIFPQVAVVRPASITGPRGRYMRTRLGLQSALAGQLKDGLVSKFISLLTYAVPVTPKWCRQFVHEDDVADIVMLLAFSDLKADFEVFNLAPPDKVLTGRDIAQALGKRALVLPPLLVRMAFFSLWHLTRGRIPTSKGVWKCYSYPIPVNGSRITSSYGFHYSVPSRQAYVSKKGRYFKYISAVDASVRPETNLSTSGLPQRVVNSGR